MPSGLVMVVVFPIAGRLSDKTPPGVLIGLGLLMFAWSSYLTSDADVHTGFWALALWTALGRIGMGFIFPSLSIGSLRVLPPALLAQGSGAVNFTRQLGGAFGVNLLAVILERRTTLHADSLAATQTPANALTTEFLTQVAGMVKAAGLPDYQQLPAASWFLGNVVYAQASTMAYRDCFLITAIIFAAALVPTWLLDHAARRKPSD
jgi:MFS family permease